MRLAVAAVFLTCALAGFVPTVIQTPPTTSYPLDNASHVEVSWRRFDTSKTCPRLESHSTKEGNKNKRDVAVTSVCAGEQEGDRGDGGHSFALCLPVLQGSINEDWLRDYVSWYARMGVSQVFAYARNASLPSGLVNAKLDAALTWIEASWLADYDAHANGQSWALQDCLWRTRTRGDSWVLFIDLDELLVLPPKQPSLLEFTQFLDKEGLQGASFPSWPYLSSECAPRGALLGDRFVFRSEAPEGGFEAMGSLGRRKYLIRPADFFLLNIHFPNAGRLRPVRNGKKVLLQRGDAAYHDAVCKSFKGSDTYLKHLRGAPFKQQVCKPEPECRPAQFTCPHAWIPSNRNMSRTYYIDGTAPAARGWWRGG